jgi:hypothetical protein
MNFQTLVEKIKNPLRKKALASVEPDDRVARAKELAAEWKEYIKFGKLTDRADIEIRRKYKKIKMFPERAERWLDQQAEKFGNQILRSKVSTPEHTKIYELMGVQVFLDKTVTESFEVGSKRYTQLVKSMQYMITNIRGLLPNKKPRIVITDGTVNPLFKDAIGGGSEAAAISSDRIIYIDQTCVNLKTVFVHEFAHMVADLIPKQTEAMLERAYNEVLDIYWRGVKVKRRNVQSDDLTDDYKTSKAYRWRKVMSSKLGFPEYGLTNPDEFFASIIEHWNKLPNNRATYKYKTLVKNVLTRL